MKSEDSVRRRLAEVEEKIDSLSDLDMRAFPETYDNYMTMQGELEGVLEIDDWIPLNADTDE